MRIADISDLSREPTLVGEGPAARDADHRERPVPPLDPLP
jgi:hypothetical protein